MVQAIAAVELQLKNVTFAPQMDSNLLSTTTLYDRGFEVSSRPGHSVRILKGGTLIVGTIHERQLFHLKTAKHRARSAKKTAQELVGADIQIWHQCMAHLGKQNIIKLVIMADGMHLFDDSPLGICQSCKQGKQMRTPSHELSTWSKERGDLIHCNLYGPIEPTTIGGQRYAMTFTNDDT
jgi:hypothetical protein